MTGAGQLRERRFVAACQLLVAASLVVQTAGVLRRTVHGDEFIFLGKVYAARAEGAAALFQTAYAHLFGWLATVGGFEVAQIQAGRGVLLACWVVTLLLLYQLARRLADAPTAWAAVALAALFRENLIHAASFRIDGLMAPVFLGACLAAVVPTRGRVVLAGVLAGTLLALSIKAVLLLPVVVLLAALGDGSRGEGWRRAFAGGAAFLLTTALLLGLHATTLATAPPPVGVPATPTRFLLNAGYRMLIEGGLFPRWGTLVASMRSNLPAWILLAVGAVTLLRGRGVGPDRGRPWLPLVLAAPLLSFVFYRNFWPYAFVSLAAGAWVLGGVGWWSAARSGRRVGPWLAWGAFVWAVGVQLSVAGTLTRDGTILQRQVLGVVHELFPEPVPYIDRLGMVASFPRPLFNMTTFGMETYRSRGGDALTRYVHEQAPPFLIVNTSSLDVFPGGPFTEPDPRPLLLPGDQETLRRTYTHLWGPVFLAGHRWDELRVGQEETFTITVPGPHTLLADGAAFVDGARVEPGGSLVLDRGRHAIVAAESLAGVRLVWGRGVREPSFGPLPGPIFHGF